MSQISKYRRECRESPRREIGTGLREFLALSRTNPDYWLAKSRWLVRSPNPLGDACMSLPAVRALKLSHPDRYIAVTCRENLTSLWESADFVDEVIPFSKGISPWAVGRILRDRGRFDAGLLLPNSYRSALELRLGGVKDLVGYARYQRGILLRYAIPERPCEQGRYRHHAHRYLDLVKDLGGSRLTWAEATALPPPPTPIQADVEEIHLGICAGAEYGDSKRYPIDRYAQAIQHLRKQRPATRFRVSLFGSPAERALCEELANLLDEPRCNRAGETSISELVEELRTCHLLVTNDTGTMHLAAALGVPTVAIFGSTEPEATAPLGTIHRVIREPVECSPCFLRECPIDHRCMLRIDPQRVSDEIVALLDQQAEA